MTRGSRPAERSWSGPRDGYRALVQPIPDQASDELDLREYVTIVWRHKVLIASVTLFLTAVAIGISLAQAPSYRASSDLLLRFRPSSSLLEDVAQNRSAERTLNNEVRLLESRPVREAAKEAYEGTLDVESVKASVSSTDADVITVTASAGDPDDAATLVNSYVKAYIEKRRNQRVQELLAVGDEVRAKVSEIQKRIDELPKTGQAPQLAALQTQLTFYQQQLDEVQLSAGIVESGTVQVLDPAEAPAGPYAPQPERNAVIAGVLGLLLGVGLAFVREHFDDSVASKDDVDRVAAPLPVIGVIPAQSEWKDRDRPRVITVMEPRSPAAEAYRTLRTSVQFRGLEEPLRLIQVTSPSASEGKTTTLANLAVAFASSGQRVAVVCCDLRRPRVHEFFQIDNRVGFTTVMLGEVPLSAALQPVPKIENLWLLPSGVVPQNPAELLGTRQAANVFNALGAQFDLVLVDCPPVLPVADAAILASRMDGTLLVASAGSTTRTSLRRALEALEQVDAPLLGVVLNGVTAEGGYGYSGYYYYGRSSEKNGKPTRENPVATRI